MEKVEAHGRYLVANQTWSFTDMVTFLKREGYENYNYPKLKLTSSIGNFLAKLGTYAQPPGTRAFVLAQVGKVMLFDNSKVKEELGIQFIPAEQTFKDTVPDLIKWGHLQAPTD
jgi:hypothetical protein